MSYQPLHHKYRPQTFAQLVGQEAIATTLTQALEQQRIPPAYLFTGARGTGKTSSARIMAKSLNCIQSEVPTATPCGVCEVCRSIANGSALDVIEIDAASNTGVDNIRELIERAQFAPVQCRYKVYAIDECHMLSTAAFNALLKTLEEPPDRVVFILATTDPQRVLPTIISRCQRFDFRRIPLTAMVGHLNMIAGQEAIAIADEALTLVAQLSQGGLRDAESLLDQLSLSAEPVTAEKVWDLVGAVPERDLMALLEAIAATDPEALLDHTRRLMDRGREPLIVLQNLASFYRDLLIAKTSPQRSDLIALTPPTWEALCHFAQTCELGTILWGQQHLRSSEVQLKHTTQPRLWLEVTLMGLMPAAAQSTAPVPAVPSTRSPSIPPQRVTARPPVPASTPRPPVAPPPEAPPLAQTPPPPVILPPASVPVAAAPELLEALEPPASARPIVPSDLSTARFDLAQTWQQVLAHLEPRGTQALLSQQGALLAFNGQEAQLGIRSQPLFKMLQERLPNVEEAFFKVFGTRVRVSLQVADLPPLGASVSVAAPSRSGPPNPPAPEPPPDRSSSPSVDLPPSTGPDRLTPIDAIVPPPTPAPAADKPPAIVDPILPSGPDIPWQTEDDGIKAAKSLAYAFNGDVVDLDTELDLTAHSAVETTVPEPIESDPDPDDDDSVDF